MIQYSLQQLQGVIVETRLGEVLGALKDLVIEVETPRLVSIVVRPHGLVKSLISGDLVIPVEKVLSISLEAVIVEDLAVPEQEMKNNIGVKLATGGDAMLSMDVDQN